MYRIQINLELRFGKRIAFASGSCKNARRDYKRAASMDSEILYLFITLTRNKKKNKHCLCRNKRSRKIANCSDDGKFN